MAATDEFGFDPGALAQPAAHAEAVTPSDTVELTRVSRALWVGVAGHVKVTMKGGEIVTFSNMTVGWHPLRVKLVWSAVTTATNITAVS